MIGKKIILVAGGTGGHVFPAISLAERLKGMGHDILIITDLRGKRFEIEKNGVPVKYINVKNPSQKNVFLKMIAFFSLIKSTILSWKIISDFSADVIVGFGGYPSLPPLLASHLMCIPSILHEQNAVLGRANRWLLKRATFVAKSFKNTSGLNDKKIVSCLTGNPVRTEFLSSREISAPTLAANKEINLLIVGGSLGARFLSEAVPSAVASLNKQLRERLVIKQQCRIEDIQNVTRVYKKAGIKFELKTFFHQMPKMLQEAHLVIARSGASTVAELAVVGRPAIFIPYPFALDNHQQKNTIDMVNAGGAWCCEETNLKPEALANVISKVLTDENIYNTAIIAARNCGVPDAVERLANLVLRAASRSSKTKTLSSAMLVNALGLFLFCESGG